VEVDVGDQQVPQPGLELGGMEWGETEVVEEFVAVFEVAELSAADQQHHGKGPVAVLADRAEEGPTAVGVGGDVDDRARPSASGLVIAVGARHRLPRVAPEIQRARQFR
jgi:hypothetical protein